MAGLVGLATYQSLAAGGAPPAALAAFAGHTILANAFPWNQGKYDDLIGKQLQGVSDADKKKAAAVAVPIATKLFKDRWAPCLSSGRGGRWLAVPLGLGFWGLGFRARGG